MQPVIVNDSEDGVSEKFLIDWVEKVSKALEHRGLIDKELQKKEISLVFLRETDAKNLNWTYRQKDYPTDILSFETEDPESIGELVMCPMVLKKQAKDHKMSDDHEMGYMVLHGILHLLGYEHEKDELAERKMMALQDEIFQELTRPVKKATKKASLPAAKTVSKAVAKSAAKKLPKKKPAKKPSKKTK